MLKALYQKRLLHYFLISVITFFVWHKTINLTFLGEGYYYFNSNLWLTSLEITNSPKALFNYDTFAKLFFQILTPIFRDNIWLFQITSLAISVILFVAFYEILARITRDRFLSLTAALFLSSNYFGLFEYLGAGNYQRFVQRIPNLIPTLIAFYFLWKFLKTNTPKFLLLSFLCYITGILMGHFSSILFPLFAFFPFIQLLEKKINLKVIFSRTLIVIAFTLTTLGLTHYSDQKPPYTLPELFKSEPNIPQRIIYQIPAVTFPLDAVIFIAKNMPHPIRYPYTPVYKILLIPAISIYIGGLILTAKREPRLSVFFLALLVSMIGTMFLYIYVDPRLNVLKHAGEDRYFLPPAFFTTAMWAIILKALFSKSRPRYVLISIIILIGVIWYNTHKVWAHTETKQNESEMNRKLITYLKNNKDKFGEGSLVVTPSYLSWPGPMISQVTVPGTSFIPNTLNWERQFWGKKEKVFVFDYDRINGGEIIDLTEKYRTTGKVSFLYE